MKKDNVKIPDQQPNLPVTVIRKAHRQDAELLVELGKRSFHEAFAAQTSPEDMARHLRTTFL